MDITKSIQVLFAAINSFRIAYPQTSSLLEEFPSKIENREEIERDIEKDISRIGFYVKQPGNAKPTPIDKEGKPIKFLRELLCKLSSIDEYYQEIVDFLIPIIYAQVMGDENAEYADVERTSMCIYEKFLYPYLKDKYALAIKYDNILKTIPGYHPKPEVADIENRDLPLAELKHTALWFSRIFNYYDLVYIYEYLLRSELHMPYMFFIASIGIIRKREKMNIMDLQDEENTLGKEFIDSLIAESDRLNKEFQNNFKKSGNARNYVFLGLAAAGVAVAVGATIFMSLEKNNRK